LELKILWKHHHLYFSSVLGSSHGLSGSKPEPATIVRSQAIWSQSHNNSLAPLIYGSAHVASGSEPSRGNTNARFKNAIFFVLVLVGLISSILEGKYG
jgi:hypothetical protein